MIEFALISMLLFLLLLGIVEMSRLLFIWSQVASAAQEGSRYGATHPLEVISTAADPGGAYPAAAHNNDPCNIVAQARRRIVLVPAADVGVQVGYDDGNGASAATANPFSTNPPDFHDMQWRVVVTTTYQFNFISGLLTGIAPAGGMRLQMVSARTVLANEQQLPTVACSDGPP